MRSCDFVLFSRCVCFISVCSNREKQLAANKKKEEERMKKEAAYADAIAAKSEAIEIDKAVRLVRTVSTSSKDPNHTSSTFETV